MLILPQILTAREARATLAMLGETIKAETGPGPVTVDATRLQQLDSSALGVLMDLARTARAWRREFVVRGPPPRLQALARLYGVDGLLFGPPGAAGPGLPPVAPGSSRSAPA